MSLPAEEPTIELTPRGQSASLPRVTGSEHGSSNTSDAGGSRAKRVLARLWEWFWRAAALAELAAALPKRGERAFSWVERARQSESLARAASMSRDLGGEASACELYRQSAYWAQCALNRDARDPEAALEYSESLWATVDERWLVPSAATAADREAFRVRLGVANFVLFAELPLAEQAAACVQLRALALSLLQRIADERRDYERMRRQRMVRLGALLLVVCVLVVGVLRQRSVGGDLAEGTPWRISSTYSGGGDACLSPQQTCPGAERGWFFHTEEGDHDPWIEFEFDARPLDISMVEIENRTDCCAERALPLVIEVSLDHNSWQQVAQRTKPFSTWHASFPSAQASWLRVRLAHKGTLHLKRIRIFK